MPPDAPEMPSEGLSVVLAKMINTTSKMAAARVMRILRGISFYSRLLQKKLTDAVNELKPIFIKFEANQNLHNGLGGFHLCATSSTD